MGKHQRFTAAHILLSLIVVLSLAACRQSQQQAQNDASTVTIELHASPEPPTTGDTTLLITLTDKDSKSIRAARLEVRGDMTHAGMQPVSTIVDADADPDGVYYVPFQWTMSGDWVISVNVTLANGETYKKTFDLTVKNP